MPLTAADKRKINKIKALSELAGISFWSAEQEPDDGIRERILNLCEDRVVRAGVIAEYVLIDELLTDLICQHFFPKKKSFTRLWKTRTFKNFNFHIMEDMSLLKKLTLVKSIIDVPKPVAEIVQRINSIRNALAHSFFPENRREHKQKGRVTYRGHSLLSLAGYKAFSDDAEHVIEFFFEQVGEKF
ncbi:MAG: hypothetical protein ACREDM_02570 [Methylocella sp.]